MQTISSLYPLRDALTLGGLNRQLDALGDAAINAVKNGANIIHLSDKKADYGSDAALSDLTYIPPLLAVVLFASFFD